ncbi:MAG: hypothetical protein NT128_04345 [Proteobacteria bacterium]|nr:hypothetical protein [Pseudomonadota bacterium]
MLNIIAILFVIFGLIGLFTLAIRYLHSKSRLSETPLDTKSQSIVVEPPIIIDSKRSIINITNKGQRYVILTGPNNDILLENYPAMRMVEPVEFETQDFERKNA